MYLIVYELMRHLKIDELHTFIGVILIAKA